MGQIFAERPLVTMQLKNDVRYSNGAVKAPLLFQWTAFFELEKLHTTVSLATFSASHFTPCRGKLICARASSPLPSSICTLPSPNLA